MLKILNSLVSIAQSYKKKRLVKFSGHWVDSDLPFPRSANTFFANINRSEIQLLLGISNFITEDVKALAIFSFSPQKVVELRDFLTSILAQYESKFGSEAAPTEGPSLASSDTKLVH